MREYPATPSSQPHLTSYTLEGSKTFEMVKDWLKHKGIDTLNTNLYQSYPIVIHWFNGAAMEKDVFLWMHSEYRFQSERELFS